MPHTILTKIGLTPAEAEIYEILLSLGNGPVAQVLKATGHHPQVVYRVMDSLEKKGLVISTTRQHRRHVRAERPSKLEEMLEKRFEELKQVLPKLNSLQKIPEEAIVRVGRGNEAVHDLRRRGVRELTRGGIYYIIGGSGSRYYEVMGDLLPVWERSRVRKKIWRKLVTSISQREKMEIAEKSEYRQYTAFRYLSEQFSVPTSTNIFNDTVAIIIWSPEPIVITIESPEVAESYRNYFASLWKFATP